MRRRVAVMLATMALLIVSAAPALADHNRAPSATPPPQACGGLDRAHPNIHGSGTIGEHVIHDLRSAAGCS